MHTTPVPRTRGIGWAVVAAIGCLLVAGYFFVAAALARVTLFGEDVSPYQLARSREALAAATWTLVAAPVAAIGAMAVGRWLGRGAADHGRRQPSAGELLLGWVVAFVAAMPLTRLLPTDARPLGFGGMWAVGGAVLAPAVIALVATSIWRQPVAPPPPPSVDRSSTPWWSGE